MNTVSREDVAFLGAGSMGRPMVARLIEAGHRVVTWARSLEGRRDLQVMGADVMGSPGEAVANAGIAVTCFFSFDQLWQVLVDNGVLDSMKPGDVIVNHVTVSARAIERLAVESARRGVEVMDAPVSGTPSMIEAGRLAVLMGGEERALRRACDVVRSYAEPIIETGGVGTASKVKLLNNALFAAHAQIAESAVQVIEQWGLDTDAVVRALNQCSGSSGAFAYLERSEANSLAPTERYLRKDVAALRSELPDAAATLGLIDSVIRQGPLPIA